MVLGSSPVAVTSPSDFAPASSKEFLDIQATTERGFTLKRIRDMTRTYGFQWSIIAGLNYNNVKEKELKKLLKFKRVDTDFSSHQRYWENFEQENNLIALNVLFVPRNSEEIKFAYKSS